MADYAALAIESVSAARELTKYACRIYDRVRNEQKKNRILEELQVFEVDHLQIQLDVDIQLARDVLANPFVEDMYKDRLRGDFKRITLLLRRIDGLLDEQIKNAAITKSRARHAARNELRDLGNTQAVSNAVMAFHASVMSLRALSEDASPLFLGDRDFTLIDPECQVAGPTGGTFLGKGRLTAERAGISTSVRWFLFESKSYHFGAKTTVESDVRILAHKLHRTQPRNGILPLVGYRDTLTGQDGSYQLVFSGPFEGSAPQTLSELILNRPSTPSLNYRVSICHQLAIAVLQTQTLRLVHKNIRPQNILITSGEGPPSMISDGAPTIVLCGWQYGRPVEKPYTRLMGEVRLERKIYQHPERQVPTAEKEYSMGHDAYSLGVCMIEIILWRSLLTPDRIPHVSSEFIDAFQSLGLQPESSDSRNRYTRFPDQIKATLISLCETRVPESAGSRMSRLIRSFLTCLDDEETEDVDEGQGNVDPEYARSKGDRTQAATQFVDVALKQLRDIQCAI